MNKTTKVIVGVAIGLGALYLWNRYNKKKAVAKSAVTESESTVEENDSEESSSASGVQNVGFGWYVRCADGSSSKPFGSYDEAQANVDKLCANRGGGGVLRSGSGRAVKANRGLRS